MNLLRTSETAITDCSQGLQQWSQTQWTSRSNNSLDNKLTPHRHSKFTPTPTTATASSRQTSSSNTPSCCKVQAS